MRGRFEERLEELRTQLAAHQQKIEKELQGQLDKSREQIIEFFLPTVIKHPPDAYRGRFVDLTEANARKWIENELRFPNADQLIKKMELQVRYKDMTFETLNHGDFLNAVKAAFPEENWDRAYDEFRAAGESRSSSRLAKLMRTPSGLDAFEPEGSFSANSIGDDIGRRRFTC
jgi:hypothetical protein